MTIPAPQLNLNLSLSNPEAELKSPSRVVAVAKRAFDSPLPASIKIRYASGSVYQGETKQGLRHGTGTLTYADGSSFTGTFENDMAISGDGMVKFTKGRWYEGQFHNKHPHGEGTYHYENGDQYTGSFEEGKRHGQGTLTYKDGKKFTGIFHLNNPQNGEGAVFLQEGFYEGSLANFVPYGYGKIAKPSGEVYEGEFEMGLYHGRGHLTYPNGHYFKGKFVQGSVWKGEGQLKVGRGEYKGEFNSGKPSGLGRYESSEVLLVGYFSQGRLHGIGEKKFLSGDHYSGNFHSGLPSGQGTLTYQNGDKFVGEFLTGTPHKGLKLSVSGQILMELK